MYTHTCKCMCMQVYVIYICIYKCVCVSPWGKIRLCAAQKSRTFEFFGMCRILLHLCSVGAFFALGAMRVHFFFDFFSIFFVK